MKLKIDNDSVTSEGVGKKPLFEKNNDLCEIVNFCTYIMTISLTGVEPPIVPP